MKPYHERGWDPQRFVQLVATWGRLAWWPCCRRRECKGSTADAKTQSARCVFPDVPKKQTKKKKDPVLDSNNCRKFAHSRFLSRLVLVYLLRVFGVTVAVSRFLQRNPFTSLIEWNHRPHRVIWVKTSTEKRNIKGNSRRWGRTAWHIWQNDNGGNSANSQQAKRTTCELVKWHWVQILEAAAESFVLKCHPAASGWTHMELLMNYLCRALPPAVCNREVIQ